MTLTTDNRKLPSPNIKFNRQERQGRKEHIYYRCKHFCMEETLCASLYPLCVQKILSQENFTFCYNSALLS